MASANLVEFTDNNFKDEVASGLVLVDFWAPWCGPCVKLGPTIEELATDYQGKVKVGKMNVDDNQQTAMQFHISGIPAVLLFKDGEPVETMVGLQPKRAYVEQLDKYSAA